MLLFIQSCTKLNEGRNTGGSSLSVVYIVGMCLMSVCACVCAPMVHTYYTIYMRNNNIPLINCKPASLLILCTCSHHTAASPVNMFTYAKAHNELRGLNAPGITHLNSLDYIITGPKST